MINFERELLDWLYYHPYKHKKILRLKKTAGYYQTYTPEQILKEIESETDLGMSILNDVRRRQGMYALFSLQMNSTGENNGFVSQNQED